MHPPGEGGGPRPSRERRRRQLAAARASDRAFRDARLAALVAAYRPVVYEGTGQARLRPYAEFTGYRNWGAVISISSPAAPQIAVDRFRLACRTLAALEVDGATLVAGDELALMVSASADHPSDLSPFVIGLTYGPAGLEPGGRLVPYQFDRHSGTVTWGDPRQVRASHRQGLWVEELGPMCLTRAALPDEVTPADLLDENRRLGHTVLQL
jgi:hypothetical protein